mmetsp:Transcript_57278/g.168176  ORF Transcript_57278/g.168176 Transcript_57278/m.168176 type:complete len:210 (-) Transcript_57278:547-1176(-)
MASPPRRMRSPIGKGAQQEKPGSEASLEPSLASQMMPSPAAPVTTLSPCGQMAQLRTALTWPSSRRIWCVSFVDQITAVLSRQPVTARRPSGKTAQQVTPPSCCSRDPRMCQVGSIASGSTASSLRSKTDGAINGLRGFSSPSQCRLTVSMTMPVACPSSVARGRKRAPWRPTTGRNFTSPTHLHSGSEPESQPLCSSMSALTTSCVVV